MTRRSAISFALIAALLLIVSRTTPAQGPGGAAPSSGSESGPVPMMPPSQNSYSGSVPGQPVPGILHLSLQDAIERGLKQNLGLLLSNQGVRSAQAQRWQQLSNLLPHLTTSSYMDDSKVDLAEFGFTFKFPGISIPAVVGPFAYFDTRAYVTQNVLDFKSISNTHSASQSLKSAEYTFKDARDLVILAVGNAYLQAIADQARIETANAQVNTAQALFSQADDQVKAGTSPAIDALRAHVELQTRQQQLIQSKNDFEIQKLTLARVIGLAPGQQFDLTDTSPYQETAVPGVDEEIKLAYSGRSDYQSALADERAAEYSKHAAEAGYYPSFDISADYGLAGTYPNVVTHGIFDVRGTLTIPIFQGGSVHGDIVAADSRLEQSRERLEDLRAQIDTDVRTSLFNLESASEQVVVAESNIDLAEQTLTQSRDRFRAGVTDTVEVVQSQEQVASAHESYISSLYAYNYAKISLIRATGQGEAGVTQYFKGK